jgi:hypothetical protein
MTIPKGKRYALWVTILTLIFTIGLPTLALADPPQGKGKSKASKQERKNAKFKNGHDARDGRWDGRGPSDHDDDDDDNYGRGKGRGRDRDRDNDGISNRTEIRRQALSNGYREGYSAGRDDRASGQSSSYDDHSVYRDATAGYRSSYGDENYYRSSFREGFRQGYNDGYRNRSSRSGGLGGILGDILGRP